jgi:hypothetical protein
MKTHDIKMGIYKIICVAAKNHGQAFGAFNPFLFCLVPLRRRLTLLCFRSQTTGVQMTIMQNLQYAEHLSEPMAELVTLLNKEFDYSQLGEDVLRYAQLVATRPVVVLTDSFAPLLCPSLNSEIAARQFNTADSKGPRSFSKFLVRLAEISPRLVLKQIALLQKHLDSEVNSLASFVRPRNPSLTLPFSSPTPCATPSSKSSASSSASCPSLKDSISNPRSRSVNSRPSSISSSRGSWISTRSSGARSPQCC